MRWMEEGYKSELEKELDEFRGECLDILLWKCRDGSSKAFQEISETYKIAIEAHTIEYLNNREVLLNNFYRLRQ